MNPTALQFSLGNHWIIECFDCSVDILNDAKQLEQIFVRAAHESGATVLSSHFHEFNPQGISGVVIIAESHISVHTWPEHRYAAVDVFTCGSKIDIGKAQQIIRDGIGSSDTRLAYELDRGILEDSRSPQTGTSLRRPGHTERPTCATRDWEEKFIREQAWGILTSLDVHSCDPALIRDAKAVEQYCHELCERIEMKRFGDTVVVDFGEDERVSGFSLVQLIETSLISGHFANQSNTSYIDIFSCKYYNPQDAAEFTMEFFKGKRYTMNVVLRK